MRILFITLATLILTSSSAAAELRVVTTYKYIADIAQKIGKDKIKINALARGNRDPHHIVPRPSLITKTSKADLLIINGAELEIGWMPPILRDSRNPRIQPGKPGFIELASYFKLIQVPDKVSRAQGDIHPAGNPHFSLNPDNVKKIAKIISDRLCDLDIENIEFYKNNYKVFKNQWNKKLVGWKKALKPLKGKKVIQYHRSIDYFLNYFDIISIGELEPLPGIPPTSKHILKTIHKVKSKNVYLILNDVFHSTGPADLVSKKTGIKVAVLPHDVDAVSEAKDIFSLFDEIVRRLTNG